MSFADGGTACCPVRSAFIQSATRAIGPVRLQRTMRMVIATITST